MAKQGKKISKVDYDKATMQGFYSNTFGIGYTDTEVALNFGLSTPTYFEPHDDEEIPIARVFLSWAIAEGLLESLKDVVDKHKKSLKTKRMAKKESGGGMSE